ncbi:hypothetical protein [Clostridium estertheticum]|uniref:hypothetical protein n=1 Tax=Clostridium estertheticum TaxID=238834 RepID=UPI001C0AC643|nr:hypothetical protein [Clostridium estertheticum]MBU3187211.1 hypothetical protein [Clostridium estertheticum]
MVTDKLLVKDMFEDIKKNTMESIKNVIDSCNFPLEFFMYYDEVCIKEKLIFEIESKYGEKHDHVHIEYKHLVITVFDIIIREQFKNKRLLPEINSDERIVKRNIGILHKNIDLLIDYYELYVAKNALFSDRYNVKILQNTYEFYNKEFNLDYNIQGYYEKNNVYKYKGSLNMEQYIGKPINSKMIKEIYQWFASNLDTLIESDKLGEYTVCDFLYVWSIIYFSSYTTCYIKAERAKQDFKKYIDENSHDIKSYSESILDYIKNSIEEREEFLTLIHCIEYSSFVDMILSVTSLQKEIVECIINDLIYNDKKINYTMMQYPLLMNDNGIIIPGYYILNECNVEIIMKKKSQLLYKNTYVLTHKKIIEPRICLKVKEMLEINKNFIVICNSDTLNEVGTGNQSQIDIFIYDKKNRDIMIIEIKDHISKLDNVEVTNQVKLETNAFKKNATKKNAIDQLENQEKLIRIQRNLDLFLTNVKVEDINNVYLGYCETYYLGTPRFIRDLESRRIAYIPFKLLHKMNKWKSVKKMYYHFEKARYLYKRSNYSYYIKDVNNFGYKIKIPMLKHKN